MKLNRNEKDEIKSNNANHPLSPTLSLVSTSSGSSSSSKNFKMKTENLLNSIKNQLNIRNTTATIQTSTTKGSKTEKSTKNETSDFNRNFDLNSVIFSNNINTELTFNTNIKPNVILNQTANSAFLNLLKLLPSNLENSQTQTFPILQFLQNPALHFASLLTSNPLVLNCSTNENQEQTNHNNIVLQEKATEYESEPINLSNKKIKENNYSLEVQYEENFEAPLDLSKKKFEKKDDSNKQNDVYLALSANNDKKLNLEELFKNKNLISKVQMKENSNQYLLNMIKSENKDFFKIRNSDEKDEDNSIDFMNLQPEYESNKKNSLKENLLSNNQRVQQINDYISKIQIKVLTENELCNESIKKNLKTTKKILKDENSSNDYNEASKSLISDKESIDDENKISEKMNEQFSLTLCQEDRTNDGK